MDVIANLKGREKYSSQRVSDGNTKTRLKRAEFKYSAAIIRFEHDNLIRFWNGKIAIKDV